MKKRRDKKINDKDVYNIYEYRTRQDTRRVSAHKRRCDGQTERKRARNSQDKSATKTR